MAFTASDLTSVETAIVNLSTGTQTVEVTINGKRIRYAEVDLTKLLSLRSIIRSDISTGGCINKVRFDDPT